MKAKSTYDAVKEFRGKRYTGMAVGRRHKWRYDAGEWTERKVTPDRWEFKYAVVKRRAGRAPEGSGAPVGTAYHWYIVADQVVTKLDANSYMTEMVGHKLKVAHRRADRSSWSASENARRKTLVKLLRELSDELESSPVSSEPATADAKTAPTPVASRTHRTRASRTVRSAHTPRGSHRRHTTGRTAHTRERATAKARAAA